jgi:hypothetical protein
VITVAIYINEREIIRVNAVNVTKPWKGNNAAHTYVLDDGTLIKHVRNLGAAKLAIKMLKGVPSGM